MLPPLEADPRLDLAIARFNDGEYEEAGDLAEDLFFEAVGEERPAARVLLQLCVGMVHVEQRQLAPALERLRVALDEARGVRKWMGIDGDSLVRDLERLMEQLAGNGPAEKVRVRRTRA